MAGHHIVGHHGMQRQGLLHLLFQEYKGVINIPQVLLIYHGGNDLELMKGKALVIQTKDDLHFISSCGQG